MIRPDMATMLCFVITDADMAISDLQTALGLSVDGSFNRITIDGDTSTNDTVIFMANGAAGAGLNRTRIERPFNGCWTICAGTWPGRWSKTARV
jgi:N-acetylglutamate synthase/N-acetylornithine aminotransferase